MKNRSSNRKLSMFLSIIMVTVTLFSPVLPIGALSTAQPEPLLTGSSIGTTNISKWLLDEEKGLIYVLTQETNKLLFIRTDDLKVDKEINIEHGREMELYNGKLYITMSGTNSIKVIDTVSKTVDNTWNLKNNPSDIALADGKLFYIKKYNRNTLSDKLFIFDLNTKNEAEVSTTSFMETGTTRSIRSIAADASNSILYAENDASQVFVISTKDNKSAPGYKHGTLEYSEWGANVIRNGDDVFYCDYRIDAQNLEKVYGQYSGSVYRVKGSYVFTPGGIFDRETFIKIGEYPHFSNTGSALIDSKDHVYMFESLGSTISKYNIVDLLYNEYKSGFAWNYNPGIDLNSDTTNEQGLDNRKDISEWVADDGKGFIYAISKDGNRLMFISMNDLKLKREIAIGDKIKGIIRVDDRIFVTFAKSRQVAIVDTKTQSVLNRVTLGFIPQRIEVDGVKLFYIGVDQNNLWEYNLQSGTEKEIVVKNGDYRPSFSGSDIVIDREKHILYLGTIGSNAKVYAVNTQNYAMIHVPAFNDKGYDNYGGKVVLEGGYLFFARRRFDPSNLSVDYGLYGGEIQYVKGKYIYTSEGVYDLNTHLKLLRLPFESNIIHADKNNNVYLFNSTSKLIKRLALLPAIEDFRKVKEKVCNPSINYDALTASSTDSRARERIDKWIMDEAAGYIYGLSIENRKLLFIELKDMKLKKEIQFAFKPHDMDLSVGRLYISIPYSNHTVVVDIQSQSVVDKLIMRYAPSEVEAVEGKLLYIGTEDNNKLHEYNLETRQEKTIEIKGSVDREKASYSYRSAMSALSSFSNMGLTVDTKNKVLYAANPEISGSNIYAVSLKDYSLLHFSTYMDGYGFAYPMENPVLEGEDIFYGRHKLNPANLSEIRGEYIVKLGENPESTDAIVHVDGKYIIMNSSVYDRDSYAKLGYLPYKFDSVLADSQKNIYSFNRDNKVITKTNLGEILARLKKENPKGDTETGSRNTEDDPADSNPAGSNLTDSNPASKRLDYNSETVDNASTFYREDISHWLLDEDNNLIYAISKLRDKVLFISSDDLKLKKELYIGESEINPGEYGRRLGESETYLTDEITTGKGPTDLELDDGKLYVPVSSTNKVAVIDVRAQTMVGTLVLKHEPYHLAVGGGKLYYTTLEGAVRLYEYSIATGTEKEVKDPEKKLYNNAEKPEITLSNDNSILYFGSPEGTVLSLSTSDYRILNTKTAPDMGKRNYSPREIFLQDDSVIYSHTMLDANDLSLVHGSYGQPAVFVKDKYVFTDEAVYNKDTFAKIIDLPQKSEFVLMDSYGYVYIFEGKRAVKKVKLDLPLEQDSKGNHVKNGNSLKIDKEITDWVYDKKGDYIYAISSETGNLLYIKADTLTVENEEYIGVKPTDIELYQGNLYIALSGTTKVAVKATIGEATADKAIENKASKLSFIALEKAPFYIEVGNGKLFYTGKHGENEIYAYDFATQKNSKIQIKDTNHWSFYYPGLSLDEERGLLYITDYHNNMTTLKIDDYSTENLRTVPDNSDNSDNFMTVPIHSTVSIHSTGMGNDRNQLDPVIKNGEDLFFGKSRIKINRSTETGVFGSNVLYVNDRHVFTKHGVYDKVTSDKVADLPVIGDLVIGEENGFFLYNAETGTIYKYDSVKSINTPQTKTLKVNLDKEGRLLFSWDELLNSGGYHLYYSYDGYNIAKDEYKFEIGGFSPIQTNKFTLNHIMDEWKNGIVFFGVKADVGKDWTRIAPSNVIEVRFKDGVPLAAGLSEDDFKNQNGDFDLSSVIQLSEGINLDETISSRFYLDEFLFNSFFKQAGKSMENFELNTGKNSKVVSLQIPGQAYKLLREEGKEKKFIISAKNGKYVLPVGAVDIKGIMEDPNNTAVNIEIMKETGSRMTDIVDFLHANNFQLVGSPVKFELSAFRNSNFIEIKRFGSDYFECWIPLESEPDRANTVGIYYDASTKRYQHVPTRFHCDSSGKYWAALKQNGNGTYALVKHSKTFEDIKSCWAKKDIELLASKFVVNGVNGTQFAPNCEVTRAEYVALLVRALGLITGEAQNSTFKDIKKDDWYYSVIQTAHDLGLVNGIDDGTFRPDRPINREEMAALIIRSMKFIDAKTGETSGGTDILNSFKDAGKISGWAWESVAAAVENKIINGQQGGSFAPDANTTRAESVAVIKRMLERLELIEG